MEADVIDTLAGIAPGSHLDTVRRTRRAVAREHAQKSYESLFAPADYGGFGTARALRGCGVRRRPARPERRSRISMPPSSESAATDATRAAIDAEIAAASDQGSLRRLSPRAR